VRSECAATNMLENLEVGEYKKVIRPRSLYLPSIAPPTAIPELRFTLGRVLK